ncbi:MAG: hypothetical protein ACOYOQ_11795 [Microthrixaceae bacterium]
MSDDDTIRFSPYLILGVDVGASAAEANRAFARRVKEIADGRIDLSQQDLNWAQTQFRRADELAGSLDYLRVPVGSAQSPEVPTGTLFRPAPEPLPRRTPPLDAEVAGALNAEVQRAAIIELIRSFDVRPAAPYGDALSSMSSDDRPGGVS